MEIKYDNNHRLFSSIVFPFPVFFMRRFAVSSSPSSAQAGISLLWISLLLAAGGILLAGLLPGGEAGDKNAKQMLTHQRMAKIEQAMTHFMVANGRRPCPASGTENPSTEHFGVEAANEGSCTGGAPAANFGAVNKVVGGVVPVKTLGLPDEYAFDGYGRYITYIVDQRATSDTACPSLGSGNIELYDTLPPVGTLLNYAMVLYISHGVRGDGAFLGKDGATIDERYNSNNKDADVLRNASFRILPNGSYTSDFSNRFIRKDTGADYDMIVWTSPHSGNRCCAGERCILQ